MYEVAILAGGLATRLRPISEKIPKALVDVAGKPFIVRQLNYLREQGIGHVVLCIGHLGDMVRDVVGAGENYGLKVSYSVDGPLLLGTGGALTKAIPFWAINSLFCMATLFCRLIFPSCKRIMKRADDKR